MVIAANLEISREVVSASDRLAPIRKMVQSCIQCGTCTASCPNEFAMDHTPRLLWRLVLMGQKDEIFNSKNFSLFSDCYNCTLRCPRGLLLTEAMDALKQLAAEENPTQYKYSVLFYKNFIRSVRRHGRVREIEFMTNYFTALRDPLTPFRFASLGMKLMAKGKVSLKWLPKSRSPLEKMFQKVAELEKGS
jgi:heterodisulfide reductase subunit C